MPRRSWVRGLAVATVALLTACSSGDDGQDLVVGETTAAGDEDATTSTESPTVTLSESAATADATGPTTSQGSTSAVSGTSTQPGQAGSVGRGATSTLPPTGSNGSNTSRPPAGRSTVTTAPKRAPRPTPAPTPPPAPPPRQPQTISFPALGTVRWPTTSAQLRATSSAGLPVRYTFSSNAGGCTIQGTTVSANEPPASCTIVAANDGNAQFLPASASQTFNLGNQLVALSVSGAANQTVPELTVVVSWNSAAGFSSDTSVSVLPSSGDNSANCGYADADVTGSSGTSSVTLTVSAAGPGTCTLVPSISGQFLEPSSTTGRQFTVSP
jgi:hypothetical protein